jgi:xanthine dehydrogenase accessory factor
VTDIYREIAAILEDGQEGTLVVVTKVDGHTPQIVGAKMIVRPDGSIVGTVGGGRFEHVIIERALRVLASGVPENATFKLKAELGMCCGGQMEVYMEPLAAAERLICFGAGHVAQSVVQFAAGCGFDPIVVDERPDWNSSERFPEPSTRHVEAYADFFSAFEFRPSDYVVITTHNHDHDREILALALGAHGGYVGMIGSVRKVKKTFKQLRLDGLGAGDLGRVHAPIGLDILAVSPAEIGLAIVGEMIRTRHRPSSTKTTRGAAIESLNQPRAEKASPSCEESGVNMRVKSLG